MGQGKVKWPGGPVKIEQGTTLFISIPFTWNLLDVREDIIKERDKYDKVIVGGPATQLLPEVLEDVAEPARFMPGILQRIQPLATRSTTGCPRKCAFCGVKKIEPVYMELPNWPDLPIYCDNNILAASRNHFDKVIDRLKRWEYCDFNQGIDARLLKPYHAQRFAELKNPMIRLAWDDVKYEKAVMRAIAYLFHAGIKPNRIRCYVLFGFTDTPEETLYRMETLKSLGMWPNPMRFNPLDTLERNSYIGEHWTEEELKLYYKYWSNQRFLSQIPFKDYLEGCGR